MSRTTANEEVTLVARLFRNVGDKTDTRLDLVNRKFTFFPLTASGVTST